jgi:xylulokinase
VSVLGVDIGTSGCKVVLIRPDGSTLARAYREYSLLAPRPQWAELDPNEVWEAVRSSIRACTRESPADPPRAVAMSTLGEAFLPVSNAGAALGNIIVSFDTRSHSQFQSMSLRIGSGTFRAVTGLEPLPHYALFKWQWWRDQEPEVYARTWKFLSVGGFVAAQLGAEPIIDHSLAIRTLAFDRSAAAWSEAILDASGLDVSKLPAVSRAGAIAGQASRAACHDLGLAQDALVVVGGLDQACAAMGIGITRSGQAMLSLGTTAVVAVVTGMRAGINARAEVPTVAHVVPARQLVLGGSPAGGSVLRWYRDVLGSEERAVAAQTGSDVYDVITYAARDRKTPLVFLPHLAGSRFAFSSPAARGLVAGVTFATTRNDLVRALLEGVAYEVAVMKRRLENAGVRVHALRATGGGSRSRVWLQIIADTLNAPIASTCSSDAAAHGAALLAGLAAGEIASMRAAIAAGLSASELVEPRAEWTEYHAEGLARFISQFRRSADPEGQS